MFSLTRSPRFSHATKPKSSTFRVPSLTRTKSTSSLLLDEHKPFESIPGPKPIPFFGNFVEIMRKGGVPNFGEIVYDWHQQYGDIIKFRIVGEDHISVCDPHIIEQVFRENGVMPVRTPLPYTLQYSKDRGYPPNMADANGEEWSRQRKAVSKAFLQPAKTDSYMSQLNQVGVDVVNLINIRTQNSKSPNVAMDLENISQRFAFEAICAVMFGEGLGILHEPTSPKVKEFIEVSMRVIRTLGTSMFRFPWHLFVSWELIPNYKQFRAEMDKVIEYGTEFINQKKSQSSENALLQQVYNSSLDEGARKFLLPAALMAGVDTTQISFQWMLYNLSISPDAQEKLYQEIIAQMPGDAPISPQVMHKLPYLKNCIQESLRRTAVTPMNMRFLDHDSILGGYHVPKGTRIQLANLTASRDPRFWNDPEAFRPERFEQDKVHPFSSLTFGQGQRSCLGQRIAMVEISVGIAYIIRAFKLEYKGPRVPKQRLQLFLEPDIPLEIAFTPRK